MTKFPILDFLSILAKPAEIEPVAASDGTLYYTAGQALIHDLVELKLQRLFPELQDGRNIARSRKALRLGQAELSQRAGISQTLLCLIERGQREATEAVVMRIWTAMLAVREEYRRVNLFVRLEGTRIVLTRTTEETCSTKIQTTPE